MAYRVLRLLLLAMVRVLYRPRVRGRENIPAHGPVILASNHLSFVDSAAIPLLAPRHITFLAKAEYFTGHGVRGALSRWFFGSMGQLPVPRGQARASQAALDKALAVLRAGEAFGIYPEGTRSRDGRLHRGRTGVGWLSLAADAPVVPVGLAGTERVLPPSGGRLRVAKVSVVFGTPIHPADYAHLKPAQARRALTDDVMDAIAALTGQERSGAYAPIPEGEQP